MNKEPAMYIFWKIDFRIIDLNKLAYVSYPCCSWKTIGNLTMIGKYHIGMVYVMFGNCNLRCGM